MLFGVAGGLGDYFDVDPVLIRVIFVVLGLMFWGVIVYVALALLTPQEDAAAPAVTPIETATQNLQTIGQEAVQAADKARAELTRRGIDQRRATAFGLLLVLVGAFILASNFGWLGFGFWGKWWPLGVMVLGGILLIAAQNRKPR